MAVFKFFHLSSALARASPRFHSPILFSKPCPSKSLRFVPYSSSSPVLDTITSGGDTEASVSSSPSQHHPWPEWVTFVDSLKTKGYFAESTPKDGDEDDDGDGDGAVASESVYNDMNVLKDACLSFARDRYDVFKSLSSEDIKTVVQGGCPNLFRKAVNSAKRLRAYLHQDEGDVCGACNLRGSCDRAYVILKESEAGPRTVDIVRLLLFYALDPLVISEGHKPPGRDLVESSARKLLYELTEVSGKSRDPALPKPDLKAPVRKEKSKRLVVESMSDDVEMKRGDWMCHKCNFLNFQRNIRCLKCNGDGPKKVGADGIEMKIGDWTCPECDFMNFSRNRRCLKCEAEGPVKVSGDKAEMKKGDWNCPKCDFMNFASNKKCLRCREHRPKRQLNPGEWECPSCDFLNYKKNMACLKCNCKRPKEGISNEYDEQLWRRPGHE